MIAPRLDAIRCGAIVLSLCHVVRHCDTILKIKGR